MILPLIDQKIRRAFSNSAIHYEVLASLQREIGRDLVKKIIQHEPINRVLDIGMGTGYLTNKLHNMFHDGQVVGLDYASGMIEQAIKKYDDLDVAQAHAHHIPFKDQTFDIVTSNLAYQWVVDLPKSFQSVHRVLRDDGDFIFTMFGYETLQELFEVLSLTVEDQSLLIARLPKKEDVYAWLKEAGFAQIELKQEFISTHFEDMLALVRWLKQIGANALPRNGFIGRDLLLKSNKLYNKKFKERLGVKATFEVLWITAKKS